MISHFIHHIKIYDILRHSSEILSRKKTGHEENSIGHVNLKKKNSFKAFKNLSLLIKCDILAVQSMRAILKWREYNT